jgi:KamA family protein
MVNDLGQISGLAPSERDRLEEVGRRFNFRSNEYYNSLIDWNDPNDPLRLIVIPHTSELDEDYGAMDPSAEAEYTVVRGLQHKYAKTGLLLVSRVCAAYCRFCFRKRLFTDDNRETTHDLTQALEYLREHSEIESVVLSGGDPMMLSTPVLERILTSLGAIPHIKTIRIDTKILAFNPFRVLDDPELLEMLKAVPQRGHSRVYLIAHYTHPRELTPESERAVGLVQAAGVSVYNQMPLLKGVNSDPAIIAKMASRLAYLGVTSYYAFVPRPVSGNKRFALTLREAWELHRRAQALCTGLGKTARLVMSHRTGKIEVLGFAGSDIVLRYHQSPDFDTHGRIVIAKTRGDEMWFDDLDIDMSEFEPDGGDAAVRAVMTETAARFPWYRDLVGAGRTPPLLTQDVLDRWYYGAAPREDHDAYLTSGSSSSVRRRIEYSPADQERYLATKRKVFGDFLRSRRFPVERVATDVGTGHAANTAGAVFEGLGVRHWNVRFDRPIAEHLTALREIRPEVLYTMPSILEALIAHTPDPRALGIKAVILVGEQASPHWIRNVITGALGIDPSDVLDTYGSIEIGVVAYYSHEREAYVVVDDIIAEQVSPAAVGLSDELRPDESILVVTSKIRDSFPAVRFVTYDVVRGFRAGDGKQPATFQAVVRRIGHELKHGEKISLHDIEEVVFRHLSAATVRVRTENRRVRVFIHSAQLDDERRRRISADLERVIPEIGMMIRNHILDGIEVVAVPYEGLPSEPARTKQRICITSSDDAGAGGEGARYIAQPGGDVEKHFVSLDLHSTGSLASALRRYEAAVAHLAERSVRMVHERAFGSLAAQPAFAARRKAVYERFGLRPPPLTFIEGLDRELALAGAVLYGVTPLADAPLTVTYGDGGAPEATLVETPRFRSLHLTGITEGSAHAQDASSRFASALGRVGSLIKQHGFEPTDIVRTWIYLSDIKRDYSAFNEARRRFFTDSGIDFGPQAAQVPASTCIEGRSAAQSLITIDVYCIDRRRSQCRTTRAYNTRQPEAEGKHYPMQPTFARGMLIEDGGHRELQISGTASINDRGESVFIDDPAAQIRATLENVRSLLAQQQLTVDDICQATYHFKDAATLACFREVSAELGYAAIQGPCVLTNVCRPELLFELDGIALSSKRGG